MWGHGKRSVDSAAEYGSGTEVFLKALLPRAYVHASRRWCAIDELYRRTLWKRKRPIAACRQASLNLQLPVGAKQL